MRYLLDTHAFIWFSEDDIKLNRDVAKEISNKDNDCFLSVVSLWEIAIKINLGKLSMLSPFNEILRFLRDNKIEILPIEFSHLQTLLDLEQFHKDPFDRLIVAQAINENITIITVDNNIRKYNVSWFWK